MLQLLDPAVANTPLDLVVRVFPSAYNRDYDTLRSELLQALRRLT
jgi:hypothetical protein